MMTESTKKVRTPSFWVKILERLVRLIKRYLLFKLAVRSLTRKTDGASARSAFGLFECRLLFWERWPFFDEELKMSLVRTEMAYWDYFQQISEHESGISLLHLPFIFFFLPSFISFMRLFTLFFSLILTHTFFQYWWDYFKPRLVWGLSSIYGYSFRAPSIWRLLGPWFPMIKGLVGEY